MMNAAPSVPLSVLDLSPVPSGSSARQALQNTLDLARRVDELGFHRYWLAEHHNTAMIASSVPELLIGYVAGVTRHLRVGSGGIMLPNHAPLKVAETFRTLEAFHPGRIDLGIGRAPGTDPLTAMALRRSREATADQFPALLEELLGYLGDNLPEGHPFRRITAIPSGVPSPPVWLLGSSGFSARSAGEGGFGFAFAHHINPAPAVEAIRDYRQRFQPSKAFPESRVILGVSVICADTASEAEALAISADLTLLKLQQRGTLTPLPTVSEAQSYPYDPYERAVVRANRSRLTVGSPRRVRDRLDALVAETGADELMILTMVHDHAARCHSYELLAREFGLQAR